MYISISITMVKRHRHRHQISSSSSTITTVGLAIASLLLVVGTCNKDVTTVSAFSTTGTTSKCRSTVGPTRLLPKIILPSPRISSSSLLLLHALPTASDSHRIESSSICSGTLTSKTSSSKSSRSDRSSSKLSAFVEKSLSIQEIEASSPLLRPLSNTQSKVINKESIQTWWSESLLPIISCALLITGNTVGAGCLVLPELAVGPGLLNITIMYVMAYLCNVISGCILADVAITQKERIITATTNTGSTNQVTTLPTSLNDFATMNFESSMAGNIVAAISLFVNSCVMAFDLNRFGSVLGGSHGNAALDEHTISILIATMIVTAMTTLSSNQLSLACSVFVTALFLSFGSLLLPGLVAVPDDVLSVFMVPGTSPDLWNSATSTFPIILMSMIFQNIIPVVVKQLHYDRTKSMTAISVGSMIPLLMYVAWCYTCLGGGVDMNSSACCTGSPLLTIFSIATLGGSSLCTGMSLAEEFNTIIGSGSPPDEIPNGSNKQHQSEQKVKANDTSFSLQTTVPSVAIPLIAALVFGNDNNDSNGLTGALAIAGSLGSPLLYGFLPALMAWRQRQEEREDLSSSPSSAQPYMIPSSTLPALGFLSTIFVGQELLSRFSDFITFAT